MAGIAVLSRTGFNTFMVRVIKDGKITDKLEMDDVIFTDMDEMSDEEIVDFIRKEVET